MPVPGDYDGDGRIDVGVYDEAKGDWFLGRSTEGFLAVASFGGLDFVPVPGDYDGDGETDVGVYDIVKGEWYISRSTAGLRTVRNFGGSGFVPATMEMTRLLLFPFPW